MLSKLKNLKLSKITIISISILISLALCFGFFYAALINQEKQKMEVSVLEISPYMEEVSISGKEITQNYAVTTINGKKYINNLNTVKLLLKGTDENYSGNSLTASNIVVKVGGSVVTPKTKTLGSAQNITNGVQYELTLAGIPGNGVLTVEVDANTLTDKSQNKNILTKFDSKIEVDNTAPTIAASDITYGDTLQITLSDSSSLVNKWAITSSNVLPTTGWNEITQTQKQTVTKTGLTVGTYYIWAKDSVENVSSKSIKVTGKSIDNSSISVALNPTTYTYDGTEKKPGVTVKDGTNTLTVGTDYSFVYSNNINAGTGKVTITGKGNYTGTKIVNFTINKRTLTVKAEAKSKTYGAGDPGLTYTYSNQVSGQTPKFSGALSRAEGENVGTYAINKNTLVLVDNSPFLANNYTLSYVGTNLTITAKNASTFTATLNPTSYTYDGTEKKPSVTVKDGENLLAVGTDYSFVYSDNINAGTGKVTITGKGNYTGTKVLNFTINKRAITVKASDGTKTYDGAALTNAAVTLTEGTLVSGQSLTATATGSITNVGSTANTVSSAVVKSGTTDVSGNYTITKTNGTLTVNKRTLTVKAEAKSKTYGAGDPGLTYTYSNQVSGQTPKFSGALSRDAGENVGTYEIKQNTLALADNSPFLANNYTLAYTGANLTINKAATATAAAADKTYNGASQTGVTGSYVSWANSTTGIDAGSYTAIATPDENHAWSDGTTAAKSITWTMSAKEVAVTWGTTTTFIYNGVAQGPTASAESGVTGETINITRTTGTNAGSYTSTASISSVTGGRAKAGNYKLIGATKAFTINRAATATAAAVNKTYNGESQTGVTGNYVSWGGTTAGIDAGSYTATATPNENYAWSDGTTAIKSITWTMSAKEVAVTWGTTTTFIYNGVAQGPTASAESGVTGETINITRTTGTNAGSYTSTASISSVTGGRAKAGNYKLTENTKAFIINRATTATAAVADKTYNGESQTGVTGNYVSWGGTTAGIDAGSYTATATPDENHAWSDGTTAAKNITWTMSAKEVAVTWETITFTYNGAAQGPTATAESGVTGETINITRTTGTNAGSYTSTASISSVAGGRAKAENYKLTGAAKAFTINKANLTLTFSENSGSVSYQNGTGLFTVTPSGYVDSETGTLSVTSENTDYITVTSENAATAKNNTAVTVGYKANQYTSSKINIIVSIAATTNYNGVSKNYEITISDSIAPIIRVSSNTTYAKSQNVTITLSDEGSGLAAGTYGITYVGIPATNGSITSKSLSIIVSTSGIKSASTSVTVSDGTGIYDGTAIVQSIVNDVSGNSLAAGTSVTGEQYLDNTAPELSDFKYAISISKPSSYSSASYNVKFDITEGHSGMAGYYDTVDLSTSLSSTDSRWKAHTGKTIVIEDMKYGTTKKIWLKDNAGNVSYKNFSLSPVAVSTETDCYVLYPTLQSAIGTASSNSDLRKWNSFWNSYIIKKC
ncbi:MAG: beta strand repeat-containing protein [Clostridia bacterium]